MLVLLVLIMLVLSLLFQWIERLGKMYLQYYINENGDKVYTTKVQCSCYDYVSFVSVLQHSLVLNHWCLL